MTFSHHLADECLFDCYLADRAGERLDPPAAEHLADCPGCAARYDELAGLMSELRELGDAEIDRVFSAEDLQRQRAQITRRIEHIGRSARVLPFPATLVASGTPTSGASRRLPRWVAAAAAAGLVVGMAAGLSFDGRRSPRLRTASSVASIEHTAPSVASIASLPPVAAAVRDDAGNVVAPIGQAGPISQASYERADAMFREEAFLDELEIAADRPHTAELAAYDALTPHVRGISVSLSAR